MYGTANTVTDAAQLIEQLTAYVDMESDQKRQIGGRIRDLRNNSRHTNDSLALAVGVSPRAVGKWIEGKGISRDSAEKVAQIFDVDPDWLWSGRERPAATPDLMATLSAPVGSADLDDRLEWIEGALQALLADRGLELDAPPSEQDRPQRTGS